MNSHLWLQFQGNVQEEEWNLPRSKNVCLKKENILYFWTIGILNKSRPHFMCSHLMHLIRRSLMWSRLIIYPRAPHTYPITHTIETLTRLNLCRRKTFIWTVTPIITGMFSRSVNFSRTPKSTIRILFICASIICYAVKCKWKLARNIFFRWPRFTCCFALSCYC